MKKAAHRERRSVARGEANIAGGGSHAAAESIFLVAAISYRMRQSISAEDM